MQRQIRLVHTHVDLSSFKACVNHTVHYRKRFYCVGLDKVTIEKRVARYMFFNHPNQSYSLYYPKHRPGHVDVSFSVVQ